MQSENRLEGEVRNLRKSYGFIRVYPRGQPREDYFFHKSGLEENNISDLEVGDIVSFDVIEEEGKDRQKAVNVRIETERHLRK